MTRDYIWFKTRVGFASVTEPSEILAWKFKKPQVRYIFARMKTVPEMDFKSFLGRRISMPAPAVYLAFFTDGPDVHKAIAECMARIEEAIRTKAEFCDLSQFGDVQGWGKTWDLIEWPNTKRDA